MKNIIALTITTIILFTSSASIAAMSSDGMCCEGADGGGMCCEST